MSETATVHAVPVAGGHLAVEESPGRSEPVLCIHGISSQRRLWDWLRAEAPELKLVAPDLRGRAGSYDLPGPFGLARHGDDMVAVLDHLGLASAHVCGMSMGGFVAVDLAHRYPDRVKSLVLVDGGFPMAAPPGLSPENVPMVFADRLGRLDQRWGSVEDYARFFTANTAPLLDPADPMLLRYLAHDLDGGLVRLSKEALVEDATSVFFGDIPWAQLTQTIRFLWAEWGGGAGSPPAYPAGLVEDYLAVADDSVFLPATDHAGTVMTPSGAAAVAAAIGGALGWPPRS